MLVNNRLKKNCVLVLEPCRLENVEEDVEEGYDPLLEEGVEVEATQLVKAP